MIEQSNKGKSSLEQVDDDNSKSNVEVDSIHPQLKLSKISVPLARNKSIREF